MSDCFGKIQYLGPGDCRRANRMRRRPFRRPERFGFFLSIGGSRSDRRLHRSGGSSSESRRFGFSLYVGRSKEDGRFVRPGRNAKEAQCFGNFLYNRAALPAHRAAPRRRRIEMAIRFGVSLCIRALLSSRGFALARVSKNPAAFGRTSGRLTGLAHPPP